MKEFLKFVLAVVVLVTLNWIGGGTSERESKRTEIPHGDRGQKNHNGVQFMKAQQQIWRSGIEIKCRKQGYAVEHM